MTPTTPTAQEHFRAILRDRVAPALRRLGLKGSGQAYTLPDDDHFAQIAIRKNWHSTAEVIEYSLDFSVVRRAAWADLFADQPRRGTRPPTPSEYVGVEGAWQASIDRLSPDDREFWWAVTAQDDPDAVATRIVDAIRDYGLPAMRSAIAGRAEEDGYPGTVRPSDPGAPGLDLAEFARALAEAMPGTEVEVVRVGAPDLALTRSQARACAPRGSPPTSGCRSRAQA
jgi:hypothetical protein